MPFPEHNIKWVEAVDFLVPLVRDGESVLAPDEFKEKLRSNAVHCLQASRKGVDFQWAAIHTLSLRSMDYGLLVDVARTYVPVFANGEFVIFTNRKGLPRLDKASPNLKDFMWRLRLLKLFELTLERDLLLMAPRGVISRSELYGALISGALRRVRGLLKRRPVFIHSLWRTGSTYVWSKFRQMPGYCAYYEPFNEQLLNVRREEFEAAFKNNITDKMAHPNLEKDYFYEFPLYEEGGAPLFRKSFPYDDYCLAEGDEAHELKRYLRFLINFAPGRSAFQFCRSPLRASWLRKNFRSVNIYILRSPRDQWESYVNSFPSAVALTFLIAGKNPSSPLIRPLSEAVRIPYYDDRDIKKEIEFYTSVSGRFQASERYLVFYYIWAVSLLEAAGVCDIIIDMDLVSRDKSAVDAVAGCLRMHSLKMDLSDCRIKTYHEYTISEEEMSAAENEVLGLLARELGPSFRKNGSRYKKLASSLSPEYRHLFEQFT